MINVTTAFKNAMKAPVKSVKASVQVGDTTFNSADKLVKIEQEATGIPFGSTMKSLSFTLLDTGYDFVGKKIVVKFSVATGANTWEDCLLGNFYIKEQIANLEKGMTSFKAYDLIGTMAKTRYSAGGITFPCTITKLRDSLCERFGCTHDDKALVNGSYSIAEDLYAKISNITYRDILSELAGATASLARVSGADDKLELIAPPMKAQETLTYANLRTVKLEPKYGAVNSVVLARTPQEDNISMRDEASITTNGLTELKLANNEILDDDRQELITPIFNTVKGFYFVPFEAKTEGHGWYEVGDRLAITDGSNTWEVVVTSIKLTVDGGISEIIKGVAPTPTQTDYALSGSIKKTIYNTEIKVDKQKQEISSVVSKQESLESETKDNFTEIKQTINNINTTIQETGGGNIIRNSVGYDIDQDKNLVGWTKEGNVSSETSPESVSYGAISGNQINLGALGKITQRVIVDANGREYTLSFKAKKDVFGVVKVHLKNDTDDYLVSISEETLWDGFSIVSAVPHQTYFDVVVEADKDVANFAITDLILNVGSSTMPWVQASDEVLSKTVSVNTSGITVRSNKTNDYVKLDELGLNGYSDASGHMENVFKVDRDLTHVSKLEADKQMAMRPIKIIPITSGNMAGLSFVKMED